MDNPRPEKVAVVDEVRAKFSDADAAILTEYRGLKVGELAELRKSLRGAGGEYKVYKNTLVRFAARELGLDELESLLTGPTAIAFVRGDAAGVAKAIRDYSRTNPTLVIKGTVLGGKVLDAKSTAALADLPSRDVLLAQLAGAFQAPLAKFAGLLQALPRNFAYGLKALIDQGGGVPDTAAAPETAEEAETAAEAPAEPLAESPAPDATAEPPGGEPEPEAEGAEPTAESPSAEIESEADSTALDFDASPAPDATAEPAGTETETEE
jgi:large subunit ribosomal protein L10